MVKVTIIDPDNPSQFEVPVLVSTSGDELQELLEALPELKTELRQRIPGIRRVELRFENPPFLVHGFLPAWILIGIGVGKGIGYAIGRKWLEDLSDDIYKWAKKKGLRLRPRRRRPRRRRPRRRRQ